MSDYVELYEGGPRIKMARVGDKYIKASELNRMLPEELKKIDIDTEHYQFRQKLSESSSVPKTEQSAILSRYLDENPILSYQTRSMNHWIDYIIPKQLAEREVEVGGYRIQFMNPIVNYPEDPMQNDGTPLYPSVVRATGRIYYIEYLVDVCLLNEKDEIVARSDRRKVIDIPLMIGCKYDLVRRNIIEAVGEVLNIDPDDVTNTDISSNPRIVREVMTKLGETVSPLIGYFIAGKDKALLNRDLLRNNLIITYHSAHALDGIVCGMKCYTFLGNTPVDIYAPETGSAGEISIWLRLNPQKDKVRYTTNIFNVVHYIAENYAEGFINVCVKYADPQNKELIRTALNTSRDILGMEQDLSAEEIKSRASARILKSFNISNVITSYKELDDKLRVSLYPQYSTTFNMSKVADMKTGFNPDNLNQRLYMLAYQVYVYIMTKSKQMKVGDMNSWENRMINTSTVEMEREFGQSLNANVADFQSYVSKKLANSIEEYKYQKVRDESVLEQDLTAAANRLFRSSDKLLKNITGAKWGRKENITEYIDDISILASIAQMNKVAPRVNKFATAYDARLVYASMRNIIDYVAARENGKCGLDRELAIAATITIYTDPTDIMRMFFKYKDRENLTRPIDGFISINGIIISFCNLDKTYNFIWKRCKRDLVLKQTCILRNQNSVGVYTEAGRPMFPSLVVEDGKVLYLERDGRSKTFNQMIEDGIMEYLDPAEEASIAFNFNDVDSTNTHVDLDPTMMYSVLVHTSPYSNLTAPVRVSYHSNMYRSATSTRRVDMTRATKSYSLIYAQQTLMNSAPIGRISRMNPPGLTLRLDIDDLEGYLNAEDAMAFNKRTAELGANLTWHTRTYSKLVATGGTGIDGRIHFAAPKNPSKTRRTDHLSEQGLPYPGSYIEVGDILIGLEYTAPNGTTKDKSIVARSKKDTGFVIYVIVNETKEAGQEGEAANVEILIVLGNVRKFEEGDKQNLRYAQKGVVKMVSYERMPFSEATGLTPDVVFNPGSLRRGTYAMLYEMLESLYMIETGQRYSDASAFNKANWENMFQTMVAGGHMTSDGRQIVINPVTGQRKRNAVFGGCPTVTALSKYSREKLQSGTVATYKNSITREVRNGQNDRIIKSGKLSTFRINAYVPDFFNDIYLTDADKITCNICSDCGMEASFQHTKYVCPNCSDQATVVPVVHNVQSEIIMSLVETLGYKFQYGLT